jgi:uncharacterized protein YjiK
MTTIRAAALTALMLCACTRPAPAQAQNSLFAATPEQQWRLPDRLREISGLALSPDGRVFGHDDERAIIYEIDVENGALVSAFALGDPPARGDFEALAITPGGDFWLAESNGRLYRFGQGADGAHVAFERFDTGLGRVCEVEGLAYLAAENSLILACKRNEARDMQGVISLHAWSFSGAARPWRSWPEAELARAAGVSRFRPSSLDVDAQSGRLLLLSARDGAMAEIGPAGEILAARRLGRAHVQAEGVVVARDGALVIADEGAAGRALLSRYARRP